MGKVCVHGWGYMGNGCVRVSYMENGGGVDREGVRSWMGVYGGWTYWTNREWRKPQTKTNMNTY